MDGIINTVWDEITHTSVWYGITHNSVKGTMKITHFHLQSLKSAKTL